MTLKKTQIIYETGGIGLDEVNLLKYLNENKFHISEDDYYCSSRTDIDDKNNKNTHNGTIYCTYRNKLFSIEWRNRRVNIKLEVVSNSRLESVVENYIKQESKN